MRKITLVLGGVRSGKSSYALSIAEANGDGVVYVVSATASDAEMDRRIEKHREERPAGWTVIEAGNDAAGALRKADGKGSLIIIDCLTMLIGSYLGEGVMAGETIDEHDEQAAFRRAQDIVESIIKITSPVIIVSNEVGSGVVPAYPTGRLFRDVVGWANKELASQADEVVFMVAGLPMKVK